MTHTTSCKTPLWVDTVWAWHKDGLITSEIFNNIIQYLIKVNIAICEVMEHIF